MGRENLNYSRISAKFVGLALGDRKHITDGTPSKMTTYMPMNNCTKFGALDRSVTILHKIGHKQPDYQEKLKRLLWTL